MQLIALIVLNGLITLIELIGLIQNNHSADISEMVKYRQDKGKQENDSKKKR